MHIRIFLIAMAAATALLGSPTVGRAAEPSFQNGPAKRDTDNVVHFNGTSLDGQPWWGTSRTVELSTGDVGETYLLVRSDGTGDMYFAINGRVVSATSIEPASAGDDSGLHVASWSPETLEFPAELIAELVQASPSELLINGAVPQEFKCSPFGKKAVKGAKYLWFAATGGLMASCCMGAGPGCLVCAAAGSAAAGAGADFADGYCD